MLSVLCNFMKLVKMISVFWNMSFLESNVDKVQYTVFIHDFILLPRMKCHGHMNVIQSYFILSSFGFLCVQKA